MVVLAAAMLVRTPLLAFCGGRATLRALLDLPLLDVEDRALVASLTRQVARGTMEP